MMVSYAMLSEGSKLKHIQLRFPALLYMYCDFSGFPESVSLRVVVGERAKLFATLHCKMWFLICLTLPSWNLAQSDEPWSSFACKDWDAPFIPKQDTLTYYKFTCILGIVSNQFKTDVDIIFSLLFDLCPNFFGLCCSHQNQSLLIFTKYIYVGQRKLWKSFLCTFDN